MHDFISNFSEFHSGHSLDRNALLEKSASLSSEMLITFNDLDTRFWLKGYCQHKKWNMPLASASFTLLENGNTFRGKLDEEGVSAITTQSGTGKLFLNQNEKEYSPAEIFKVGNRAISAPGNKVNILKTDYVNSQPATEQNNRVLEIATLTPPVIVNLRTDARRSDPNARLYLLDNELDYFKKMGNATIFIHGYNVRYGQYKQQIEALYVIDHPHSAFPYQAKYNTAKSTILRSGYRLLQNLEPRNPREMTLLIPQEELTSEKHLADDIWLNGEGAHNWFIHMEDNLNRATGKFNRENYDQYTRLINITWNSDIGMLNYMDAVANATESGRRLSSLIKQLHNANIKINIIAHSLGCQVLMSLLQDLGKRSETSLEYNEVIDHVYLWNPAIPDNAFSDSLTDTAFHYRFPKAHKASKKITIFSSQHDNILGPIPKDDKRIWASITDPAGSFLVTAICLATYLIDRVPLFNHMSSVYNLANLIGTSWSYMIEGKENRHAYYQHWISLHPTMKSGAPFLKSLEEQKIVIRKEYSLSFHLISMVVMAHNQEKTLYLQTLLKMIAKHSMDDFHYPFGVLPKQLNILEKIPYIDDPVGNEIATLIISILISEGAEIRKAMGYSGYDKDDKICKQMEASGKIVHVDQTPWLFTHSGMKIPSDDLMENIYKKYVINPEKGIRHFGTYY